MISKCFCHFLTFGQVSPVKKGVLIYSCPVLFFYIRVQCIFASISVVFIDFVVSPVPSVVRSLQFPECFQNKLLYEISEFLL